MYVSVEADPGRVSMSGVTPVSEAFSSTEKVSGDVLGPAVCSAAPVETGPMVNTRAMRATPSVLVRRRALVMRNPIARLLSRTVIDEQVS